MSVCPCMRHVCVCVCTLLCNHPAISSSRSYETALLICSETSLCTQETYTKCTFADSTPYDCSFFCFYGAFVRVNIFGHHNYNHIKESLLSVQCPCPTLLTTRVIVLMSETGCILLPRRGMVVLMI